MAGLQESVQVYGSYDHSVVDFVRASMFWHKDPDKQAQVPCVFATPERAFAELKKRIEARLGTPVSIQQAYPLPFISIDRTSETYDPRRDNKYKIKKMAWNADRTVYYNLPWPKPMIYLYTINVWTRNLHDLDDLGNQLYLRFGSGPIAYLRVKHLFPVGEKLVFTTITEDRKLSSVEDPNKQRALRRAITLRMEGWLIPAYETTPVIIRVDTEIQDLESGDVLETVTVP